MTVTIFPPPRLRRRSRRQTWRCTVQLRGEDRFRRAVAVHLAAHAVVLHDLRIPLISVRFDPVRSCGQLDAEWLSLAFPVNDTSIAARIALEHDCIAIHAGVVAKSYALGWRHTTCGWGDQDLAHDLIERMEFDVGVVARWHDYQRERARLIVGEARTWTRIERLAAFLREARALRAADIATFLASLPDDDRIVPSHARWQPSSAPVQASNAVLIWSKPTLTEIVLRYAAHEVSGGAPE